MINKYPKIIKVVLRSSYSNAFVFDILWSYDYKSINYLKKYFNTPKNIRDNRVKSIIMISKEYNKLLTPTIK